MIKISNILKSIIASSTFILSTILSSSFVNNMPTGHTGSIIGAGILPYVVERTNKKTKVFFLLGRDCHGKYKNTWSDFGGKGKVGENALQVAAREGSEETMDILQKNYIINKVNNLNIKNAPRIGNTFLINIEDKVGKNPTKKDMEQFVRKLNHERKRLLEQKNKTFHKLEKDKFSWWRKKDLINAINNKSKNLRPYLIKKYGKPQNIQTLKNIN